MINVKPFEIRKKILLIDDDDADVRSTTHMILNQELNIDVRVAASLDEGMEIIEDKVDESGFAVGRLHSFALDWLAGVKDKPVLIPIGQTENVIVEIVRQGE